MAGEITRTVQIAVANGNFTVPKRGLQNTLFDQAVAGGAGPGPFSAPITAGGTQIPVPATCQGGFCYIKNTDLPGSTNVLEYGSWISGAIQVPAFGKLLPGQEDSFRLSDAATFAVLAHTATVPCIIEFYNK